jgi:hypothetical protein
MSKLIVQGILEKMQKVQGGYLDQDEKGQGEQDFIDKHVDNVDVTDAPAVKAQKGHPHDAGSKAKMAPRKKERKGYEPGEDAEVYESEQSFDTLAQILEEGELDESSIALLIDEAISEFIDEEASSEEAALVLEMLSTDEGAEEFMSWILEADDDCCEKCGEPECECDDDDEDGKVETKPKVKDDIAVEAYGCSSSKGKSKKKKVKEDIEREADFKMVKTKTPEGKVIFKKQRSETEVSKKTD